MQRARNRRIAIMAAKGISRVKIAEVMELDPVSVWRVLNKPEVAALIERLIPEYEERLEALLEKGERIAHEFLIEVITMEEAPLSERIKAAFKMSDMKGERGKPVERAQQQLQIAHLQGDAAQVAAINALRDPGVRALLAQDPQTLDAVRTQLASTPLEYAQYEESQEGNIETGESAPQELVVDQLGETP